MKEADDSNLLHLRVSVKCDLLVSHFEVSYRFICTRGECGGEEMKGTCTSAVFETLTGRKSYRETFGYID